MQARYLQRDWSLLGQWVSGGEAGAAAAFNESSLSGGSFRR